MYEVYTILLDRMTSWMFFALLVCPWVSSHEKTAQDFDPQSFESLKWMLANTGMRDMGFDFEDVGLPDKVRFFLFFGN